MAIRSSKGTTTSPEIQIPKKWRDEEVSPERTKIWSEPATPRHRVPVVYYLCRNGKLEHPHFMEITLSNSPHPQGGLFLRDFINRLNQLRGKGIASLFAWSSKRSYKNGFVWHDLTENDFIYPSHGTEYVLKGSELLDLSPEEETPVPLQSPSSSTESHKPSSCRSNLRAVARRRNQSMSSIELHEYKVYKTESTGGLTRSRAAANASTQTYDGLAEEVEEIQELQSSTELSREETSPPPLDSSPETLETMLKTHGRLRLSNSTGPTEDGGTLPGGRLRASSVLMQLLSCGAVSFKGCGASSYVKGQGLSMVAHSRVKVSRGAGNHRVGTRGELSNLSGHVLENKEYFSGSLVETKRREVVPTLKRSYSYNTDR